MNLKLNLWLFSLSVSNSSLRNRATIPSTFDSQETPREFGEARFVRCRQESSSSQAGPFPALISLATLKSGNGREDGARFKYSDGVVK